MIKSATNSLYIISQGLYFIWDKKIFHVAMSKLSVDSFSPGVKLALLKGAHVIASTKNLIDVS